MESLEPVATPKTKRYLATAAVLGGGVAIGALFSPIGLAGAQTADADDDAPAADDAPAVDGKRGDGGDRGRLHHRPGRQGRMEAVDSLTNLLDLTRSELHEKIHAGQTIAEIAAEQGVAEVDVVAALVANAEERVDEAVADGRLDADEAAERLSGAEDRIEEFVNRSAEDGGFGRHRRHHRHHQAHRFANKAGFAEVAESLGISEEAIGAGRAEGKTLAEVAAEAGVAEQDLVDALVAQATDTIDQAVTDGQLTDERAAQMKEKLAERIAEGVNRSGHNHHRGGARTGESEAQS